MQYDLLICHVITDIIEDKLQKDRHFHWLSFTDISQESRKIHSILQMLNKYLVDLNCISDRFLFMSMM